FDPSQCLLSDLERYANADLYTPRAWAIGAVLGVSRRKLQEVDRRAARNRRAPVSVVEDVDRLDANSGWNRSFTLNCLNIERSRFQTRGRRNWLRRELPKPSFPAPVGCVNRLSS